MENSFTFYNGIIGYTNHNQTFKWCGSDNEQNYLQRSKDSNWEFINTDITYKLNNFGHRCENVENIDLDNYILFLGCSHSMGVGLPLEKTFPYLLAQKCKVNYYNLSLGAAGQDVAFHNLLTWCNTYKRPKVIIFQFPWHLRCSLQITPESLQPMGINWCPDDVRHFLIEGERLKYFQTKSLLIEKCIDTFKIPIIKLYIPTPGLKNIEGRLFHEEVDKARDGHYGERSHDNTANTLFNALDKYKHADIYSTIRRESF